MPAPFEPSDLYRYERIDEIDGTPSADVAVCTLLSINPKQNAYTSSIWVLPTDASPPWPLTKGNASVDQTPRLAPDGSRVAFLSDRADGAPQIFLISLHGGEARTLSRTKAAASNIEWSPDGRRLLCTCRIPVDPNLRGARAPEGKSPPQQVPEVAWRLPYKLDGRGFLLDTEVHLFAIDADSGRSLQLTDGPFSVKSAAWSPDGKKIAFTRSADGRIAHRSDVWMVDADGANARQLTHEQASCMYPAWSPDGRWIAFAGSVDEGDPLARLWLIDAKSGKTIPLGDESIEVVSGEKILWLDSTQLAFVAAHRGCQHGAVLSVPEGALERVITGERQIRNLTRTSRHFVFTAYTAASPNGAYASDLHGGKERRLDGFNVWWRDRTELQAEFRQFDVPDAQGGHETIDGWLLRSRGRRGPMPLLVDVHGGPASYALIDYTSRPYWSVLASRGWAILALNPVGSSSYGRDFSARLRSHWGEYDLPQHLAAMQALQHEGIADDRVAITGKSYGGYLTAWAIGHTKLFHAAVVSAPVGNIESHFGCSDSGYYTDPYAMCGEPFIEREKCHGLSPMDHIKNARTPTLFLQGKDDERCPRCQSEELFVTLMRSTETPAEMVLYPGGGHHVFEDGKPSFREDAARRLVEWLERWINVPAGERTASATNNSRGN